jgi:hypothetical protein
MSTSEIGRVAGFRYESARNFRTRRSFSARHTMLLIEAGLGREKSTCQF